MAFDVFYKAWNSSNGDYATGDGGNHTVTVEVDQTDVTGKTPTEVGNGVYRVNLTDTELPEGSRFSLRGSSSTSDVTLHGESGVRPETMRGTDGAATPGDAMDFNSAAKTYGDSNWATATGFSTHSAGDVWTVATRELTSNANFNDPSASTIANSVWNAGTRTLTAFSFAVDLSSSAVQAIWDKATSALTTAGSIGKLLVDNIDAAISSRSSHDDPDPNGYISKLNVSGTLAHSDDASTYKADLTTLNDPTAAAIADQVWDEQRSGHTAAGSFGEGVASVQGNVTGSVNSVTNAVTVGTINNSAITAAAIASDAITAAKIATDAIDSGEISAAAANKIADHLIRRTFSNAASSSDGDTKSFRSLLGAIAKLVNRIEANSGTLTVYEDDDSTSLGTQALTTDSSADPITEANTN